MGTKLEFLLYVIILGIAIHIIADMILKYMPSGKHIDKIIGIIIILFCGVLLIIHRGQMPTELAQPPIASTKEHRTIKLLKINYPNNDSFVELTDIINGNTPFYGIDSRNHYIIVTPLTTGDDFVQDGLVNISLDGSWSGYSKFGNAGDVGKRFLVRVIATKSNLAPGPLTKKPEDGMFSDGVKVIRK